MQNASRIDPLALTAGSASDARIAHLFRASRRLGKIHPLQHLIQRHRAAQQQVEPVPVPVPTPTPTPTPMPAPAPVPGATP